MAIYDPWRGVFPPRPVPARVAPRPPAPVRPYQRHTPPPPPPETLDLEDVQEVQAPVETAPPAPDKEDLRKALRELEAAEARVQKNAERVYEETRAKLINDLLPVLDNLDRTLQASVGSSERGLVDGVQMVREQLERVLIRYGVERIDALGQRFDPLVHHAVATVAVDPDRVGQVVEQVGAGFRFAGKVLRPATVLVGASRAD